MRTKLIAAYYSTDEAAVILGFTPWAIREMGKRGAFPGARQLGRKWRIPKHLVDPQLEPETVEVT